MYANTYSLAKMLLSGLVLVTLLACGTGSTDDGGNGGQPVLERITLSGRLESEGQLQGRIDVSALQLSATLETLEAQQLSTPLAERLSRASRRIESLQRGLGQQSLQNYVVAVDSQGNVVSQAALDNNNRWQSDLPVDTPVMLLRARDDEQGQLLCTAPLLLTDVSSQSQSAAERFNNSSSPLVLNACSAASRAAGLCPAAMMQIPVGNDGQVDIGNFRVGRSLQNGMPTVGFELQGRIDVSSAQSRIDVSSTAAAQVLFLDRDTAAAFYDPDGSIREAVLHCGREDIVSEDRALRLEFFTQGRIDVSSAQSRIDVSDEPASTAVLNDIAVLRSMGMVVSEASEDTLDNSTASPDQGDVEFLEAWAATGIDDQGNTLLTLRQSRDALEPQADTLIHTIFDLCLFQDDFELCSGGILNPVVALDDLGLADVLQNNGDEALRVDMGLCQGRVMRQFADGRREPMGGALVLMIGDNSFSVTLSDSEGNYAFRAALPKEGIDDFTIVAIDASDEDRVLGFALPESPSCEDDSCILEGVDTWTVDLVFQAVE